MNTIISFQKCVNTYFNSTVDFLAVLKFKIAIGSFSKKGKMFTPWNYTYNDLQYHMTNVT